MDEHKAIAGSLQIAHDRLKVKLHGILQAVELYIENQRKVKASRGRPAAAASSLYDDNMESEATLAERVARESARVHYNLRHWRKSQNHYRW